MHPFSRTLIHIRIAGEMEPILADIGQEDWSKTVNSKAHVDKQANRGQFKVFMECNMHVWELWEEV